ncbi:hypothetical protein AWB76_07863 [Caballeronia temeraria]|uniref:Uncharacterized protein n=1 Tax=Caballeronia temeraria TaxID=1777137 RepID=A0A158E0Z9_9BURK|nr:hypothetical protein AWB76_07863 [Caballeronia temeraria]
MNLQRIGGIGPMKTCHLIKQRLAVAVDEIDPDLTVFEDLAGAIDHPLVLTGAGEHPVSVDIINRHLEYLHQLPAHCDLHDQ